MSQTREQVSVIIYYTVTVIDKNTALALIFDYISTKRMKKKTDSNLKKCDQEI
jgi:hypothetical protein